MQNMKHLTLNISIIGYIATIVIMMFVCSSCMTTQGIDYTAPNNNTDVYVSINENNFQIWLKNQKDIGGNKGFYTIAPCPNNMGHETY
jgi:hypothetical protein